MRHTKKFVSHNYDLASHNYDLVSHNNEILSHNNEMLSHNYEIQIFFPSCQWRKWASILLAVLWKHFRFRFLYLLHVSVFVAHFCNVLCSVVKLMKMFSYFACVLSTCMCFSSVAVR